MKLSFRLPRYCRDKNATILLWIVAGLLLTFTWVHVVQLSAETRERELASSVRDLSNLTRLSQEHAIRTLRSADQVIRFVQSRYLEMGLRLDLAKLTAQGVIDDEIFNQVGVINAKGIYILSNKSTTGTLDLSDREHFKVHIQDDSAGLFISRPLIGRATGRWSIQLSRRITGPNGEFAGVVVVSIDPGYFTRFYSQLNLGPEGLTALYGMDGIARARKVGSREDYGADIRQSSLMARLANGETEGSYRTKSVVDGLERVFFFRKVPQYSLIVMAGIDTQFLHNSYRDTLSALAMQAVTVSLLILALAAGLTWHLAMLRRESNARRQAQEQIEDRKVQLDAVFELSPDGFVSFDSQRRVKLVNPAFHLMTGPDNAAVVEGMSEREFSTWLARLCDPSAQFEGIEALRRKAAEAPENALQTIELNGCGKRVLQVQLRLSKSTTLSQILCLRDVTSATELEDLKSDFLATAAHELRTPMASIFGFSELLMAKSLDEASRQEFLEIIHKQSTLMVQILNELLDLARIEARRGKDFHFAPLCLQELLVDLTRALQPPPGRSLPKLLMPIQEVHLMADSGKLRQALLNVISNAYKYSPAGGPVTIVVEVHPAEDAGQRVAVHVTDQGIGMTRDEVKNVCTRFYRADTSGNVPGAGLGMSITREIVGYHKGEINIISTPGQGTEVSLYFPVYVPAHTGVTA